MITPVMALLDGLESSNVSVVSVSARSVAGVIDSGVVDSVVVVMASAAVTDGKKKQQSFNGSTTP